MWLGGPGEVRHVHKLVVNDGIVVMAGIELDKDDELIMEAVTVSLLVIFVVIEAELGCAVMSEDGEIVAGQDDQPMRSGGVAGVLACEFGKMNACGRDRG